MAIAARSRAGRRSCSALAALLALCGSARSATAASAGPAATRLVYAPGEIVPIPASIPHEEGDMVDRRIVPDLRWIAAALPDLRHRRLLGAAAQRRTRRLQRVPRPQAPTTTTASPSTSCR